MRSTGTASRKPPWLASYVADAEHGPLPALLLGLALVTGVVDAFSVLSLGRVFVANMTGNVVFVGFAVAGAHGFSLAASLSALGGFLVGAAGGGKLATHTNGHRGELLRDAVAAEVVLAGAGLIVYALTEPSPMTKAIVAALVASAMGAQNAAVRQLAVPDVATNVLTTTLTSLAVGFGKTPPALTIRRALPVACLFTGGLVGALLVLNVSPTATLITAVSALAVVAMIAALVSRGNPDWHRDLPRSS